MSINPADYCNCFLTSWVEPNYEEKDGTRFCKSCRKEELPAEYCRCDPYARMGKGEVVENGVKLCGKCKKKLAWRAKSQVEPEDENDQLILVTIDYVPGHRIVEVLGLVTQLVGSSGLTAGVKGREAKSGALRALSKSAKQMDADAVIGIQFSAFGAGGGLTNVFGGDAVGVLVSGTAVRIEQISNSENGE